MQYRLHIFDKTIFVKYIVSNCRYGLDKYINYLFL